ncbi:MAG: extracellular solute-binding protein [Magnetospirillum sp.]|nr:extracellular solute-binding protein [Magnetospirillum sp.]
MRLGDAKGTYTAFEIAGYGFVLRPDYLERHHLEAPKDWKDLAKPAYAGHVVVPVPSTIGYAPAMVEIPLQHLGWERGWGLWAEIAANAELMGGGGGVAMINELAEGAKGIGLVMDFFVRPAKAEGKPVTFIYPTVSAVNPAHVGITAKAPHGEAARAFVRFVLSEEGQRLLLAHGVARLPVRKALYASAPAGYPRPFEAPAPATIYDPEKALARQPVLKALFDAYITERHERLKALFAAIRAAEARGEGDKATQARALVLRLPLNEAEAADAQLNALMDKRDDEQAQAIRAQWSRRVAEATDQAFAVLGR